MSRLRSSLNKSQSPSCNPSLSHRTCTAAPTGIRGPQVTNTDGLCRSTTTRPTSRSARRSSQRNSWSKSASTAAGHRQRDPTQGVPKIGYIHISLNIDVRSSNSFYAPSTVPHFPTYARHYFISIAMDSVCYTLLIYFLSSLYSRNLFL